MQKPPSVRSVCCLCWLLHGMPAGAASRYALGAGGVGAAHPAPAASLTCASRYALGARRTALRAEGAARLCAGRRSRWLPSTARATRSAPMAWALRARAPAAAFSPPRATRSAPNAWALRARAPTCCPPPVNVRALPLGGGDVEDVVRFALLETLGARRASRSCRGRGWGGVVQTSSCASVRGTLVCCRSMCSARRRGAPLGSERLPPRPGRSPALSARVLQRFALERCGQVGAARRRHSRLTQ